jgi:hypothetical protein
MRGRLVFIVLAALVTAAVAALNWPEFTRAEPLSFGVLAATVPIGVVMLVLMAVVLVVFLVSSAIQESRYLLDHRRHTRALHEQRTLAEKAEASRFTDLRQQLDSHMRESRQRDSVVATEFERRMLQSHAELRAHIERMQQVISARLGDIEARLGGPREIRTEPASPQAVSDRDHARL